MTVEEKGNEDGKDNETPDAAKELATLKRENADRRLKNENLQSKLDKIKTDGEAEATRLAEEQGEFKTLYESKEQEVTGLKTRAESAESALEKYLELELKGIPEDKLSLIPDLPTDQKLEWLAKAKGAGMFGEDKKSLDIKKQEDLKKVDLSGMSPIEKLNHARATK